MKAIKYYLAGGVMMIVAAAAVLMNAGPKLTEHQKWRLTASEPETKIRPARFEDMKFKGPGSAVELREPASKK